MERKVPRTINAKGIGPRGVPGARGTQGAAGNDGSDGSHGSRLVVFW